MTLIPALSLVDSKYKLASTPLWKDITSISSLKMNCARLMIHSRMIDGNHEAAAAVSAPADAAVSPPDAAIVAADAAAAVAATVVAAAAAVADGMLTISLHGPSLCIRICRLYVHVYIFTQ